MIALLAHWDVSTDHAVGLLVLVILLLLIVILVLKIVGKM